jgi:AAA domain
MKPKRRFAPVFLDDITVDDEPAYIVEGIIPAGPSFGEIPAPPKSLKSFFITDLWFYISIGKPYAGRQVQQGATVYVTSEGVQGVKRRLVAMRRYHQVEGKRVPFILVPVMPNLGTDGDCKQLIKDIEAAIIEAGLPANTPVKAIAIDTLRRATPGKSENDTKDMSVFIANCEAIATKFCCFVGVVHHSPRSDDSRGSGTNAIEGACDVILLVNRSEDATIPRATVTVDRMKDGEEGLSWTFEVRSMEVGKDRDDKPKYGGYVVLVDEPAIQSADPKSKGRKEAGTVSALRDALTEALDTAGRTIRVRGDGPPVKAVPVSNVLVEFKRRHVTGSDDPKKRADAQRQAFTRALEKLPINRGTQDGIEYLWR